MEVGINVKEYIAGIRSATGRPTRWLGTAFVISDKDNGYVATCYHVIGDRKTKTFKTDQWELFFESTDHSCRATIETEYCDAISDIAVLRLLDPLPQGVKVCKLSSLPYKKSGKESQKERQFMSFGFGKGDEGFAGLFANGEVIGLVQAPAREEKGQQLLQLNSDNVDDGMSGAPVFMRRTGFVVGIIAIGNKTQWNTFDDLAFARPVENLLKLWPELKDYALPELKYDREFPLQKRGRAEPRLLEFLEYCYPQYRLLERGGKRYPIVIFPSSDQQADKPESILGELDTSEVDESIFVIDDQEYLEMRHIAGGRLDDNPTYVFRNLAIEPELRIRAGVGTYFQALRTSDALEWEILAYFGKHSPQRSEFDATLAALKNRYLLHQCVLDPVTNGEGRSAAIAMSTLVVFNSGNDVFEAFVSERSSKVAVHGLLYHVIPSFMFQPVRREWEKDEWSVTHQLYREYLEELFDMKDLEDPEKHGRPVAHNWFYSRKNRVELEELIKDRKAHFRLTGVAVNLLNFRLEILTLLLIKDSEWFRSNSVESDTGTKLWLNWEWLSDRDKAKLNREWLEDVRPSVKEVTRRVRIDNDGFILDKLPLRPENMVPPGAAAFWLGVDAARQILGLS